MSEEKSKGISLRKKRSVRPKISAPMTISQPMPTGMASGGSKSNLLDVPRERPQMGATSDMVKRRYSQRFAGQVPNFGDNAPPVPSVPAIPGQFAGRPSQDDRRPETSSGRKITVDVKALRDPDLRPEQYVANLLADASEQEIMDYQQELRKVKNRTSTDLQHNVYQNRTQFIKISKEAEKLKNEMRTLRSLMTELTQTLGQSNIRDTSDSLMARKQANRSSVANLEALWNTHLQALWKRVEGSQKYLPAIPGRHVVYESGRWVELNAATWKPRKRAHLILLNDHLLIASEKKRLDASPQPDRNGNQKRGATSTQLVADRCWPLQDVQITNLSSNKATDGTLSDGERLAAANAINVRVGSESFTFASAKSDGNEKTAFLVTYRKAMEDLRKSSEAETENREKTRDSVHFLTTRDPGLLKKPDLLESLSESPGSNRASITIEVDGQQHSFRWVESQMDALDIDVALQHFDEAVQKVEKLRKLARGIRSNAVAQEIINFKVNERAAKLAAVLVRQLAENHAAANRTQQHVGWLVRLGYEDQAREAYLQARGEEVTRRSRQCIFEGDLHLYIYQISFIYFALIKNTAAVFQACFPPAMMSACVKWAKDNVDQFNIILARQLSSVDSNSKTWRECMERAQTHAGMLAEVGLDFKDLIGKGLDVDGDTAPPDKDGLGLDFA